MVLWFPEYIHKSCCPSSIPGDELGAMVTASSPLHHASAHGWVEQHCLSAKSQHLGKLSFAPPASLPAACLAAFLLQKAGSLQVFTPRFVHEDEDFLPVMVLLNWHGGMAVAGLAFLALGP